MNILALLLSVAVLGGLSYIVSVCVKEDPMLGAERCGYTIIATACVIWALGYWVGVTV